ncbi:hypothetical protein [Mucilaginibacter sp. FT3.2]|nr:hypothetical protein [Mucilaginibacter sp. FT3.2]MBB6234845.1 hypothetical protein [Mucilaginibacter sp. FT3.2]
MENKEKIKGEVTKETHPPKTGKQPQSTNSKVIFKPKRKPLL